MYYASIYKNGIGFTNQIISFIYSIIIAINEKNRVIVVDKFADDNLKLSFTPISHIISLQELNDYLLQKYNIVVMDKCFLSWKLHSVHYGTVTHKIDITKEIKDVCLSGDRLFIHKYTDFNRIKGDPSYGKEKQVYLKYEISDYSTTHTVEEIYTETLADHIVIDVLNSEYIFKFINLFDLYGYTNYFDIFEEILLILRYTKEFEVFAMNMIRQIEPTQKVNVIHLRVEKDAIEHWSVENNMSNTEFENAIEAKYIEIIQKYMDTNNKIIILSSDCKESRVIDFLIRNNYPIWMPEKHFDYREKNAIVDLLISRVCNNIFLGCISKNKNGSTFSHYISKLVDKSAMKIGINLDSIKDPEHIFY